MAKILCIESATTNCSVSLGVNGEVVVLKEENTANYSHSEQLHVFIDAVLREASVSFRELDAVAVSKGPGSYTGLRIGVSAAKGLCFALEVPLISIPTLGSMAHQIKSKKDEVIIPVLDARRMEVYSCVFDSNHREIRETRAEIIAPDSFSTYHGAAVIHLIGNGAEKCEQVLPTDKTFTFHPHIVPSAKEMVALSQKKFEVNHFEDVAYFEPYYLKDFTLQKKKS